MANRITSASLAALACAIALGGCATRPLDDSQLVRLVPQTVSTEAPEREIAQTPFERQWDLRLPAPVHAAWQGAEVPGLLVFQLATRELVAVEAQSGHTRWITAPLPALATLPPHLVRLRQAARQGEGTAADDRMVLVCRDELLCLDLASGQVIWRWALPFSPSTAPCSVGVDADQRVFLGDWRGYLRVVTLHPEKRFPYLAWQWNLAGGTTATPVTTEGQVYFGDQGGRIHAFRLDREQAWESAPGGAVSAPVALAGRMLVVGDADQTLRVLDRLTGEPLGQLGLPGPVRRQVMISETAPERVFVWVEPAGLVPGGLAAVHVSRDAVPWAGDAKRQPREVARLGLEWFLPRATRLVASTPTHLFITLDGQPGMVLAVERAGGRVAWKAEVPVEGADRKGREVATAPELLVEGFDPTDRQRLLVAVDEDGRVSCRRFTAAVR